MYDFEIFIGILACIATIILIFMFVVSNIMDWLMTLKEKIVVKDKVPGGHGGGMNYYNSSPSYNAIAEQLKMVIESIDNLPESAKMITSLDEDFVAKVSAAKEVLSRIKR